jgi:Holliday junction DNA helicase RuvA
MVVSESFFLSQVGPDLDKLPLNGYFGPMISRLKGRIWEKSPLKAVLEVGGVGYEVCVPLSVAEKLGEVGSVVELFVRAVYREESASLYGFLNASERDFFSLLIDKVSGMGPKTALALLSKASAERIMACVEAGDGATLCATPGIGKKTAERLVLELKGALPSSPGGAVIMPEGPVADARAALISLGYSQSEAIKAVDKALKASSSDASADVLIRACLKK